MFYWNVLLISSAQELYADLFSHKMKNEIQEISDIQVVGDIKQHWHDPVHFRFNLFLTVRLLQILQVKKKILKILLELMSIRSEFLCLNDQGDDICSCY